MATRISTTNSPSIPDPILAPTRPAGFVTVRGGRIAYDELGGDGPPVVAVPGLGDLRSEYRYMAQDLADRGYHVVTMDLRGHGDSSVGFTDYSVEAVADDIVALVAHLDRGPAVLIGTSFGAAAVADAAARAPEAVAGVVAIGPAVRNVPPNWLMRLLMFVLFKGPWRVAAWAWYLNGLYPSRKPADHEEQLARLKANLAEPKRFDAVYQMMIADRAATEPRLGDVRAPSLVVMGTRDADFPDPATEAQTIADRMGGDVVMVEGSGHYPHAEMPAQILPQIAQFVAQVTA